MLCGRPRRVAAHIFFDETISGTTGHILCGKRNNRAATASPHRCGEAAIGDRADHNIVLGSVPVNPGSPSQFVALFLRKRRYFDPAIRIELIK
jgi:hypothetical protein